MMRNLNEIIKLLISRREQGKTPITLLAVCPNSSAVLEAAIKAAVRNNSLMLFAATLNQVDIEASYTGWTPARFVQEIQLFAKTYHCSSPLYPCLDHGGPWLKDLHTLANLSYAETMAKVKNSLTACIQAGYKLLHIDPTVDRSLPAGQPLPLKLVVSRTVELIAHAESVRSSLALPAISYEVGTEEVHGGLVDIQRFEDFLRLLKSELNSNRLSPCWPCLLVAQIGTDLHTTSFKPEISRQLYKIVAPQGSLIKGHYTDWVQAPHEYPASGMGAANVGPEFTTEEFMALRMLESRENALCKPSIWSNFMRSLKDAVVESGRWKKWLLEGEKSLAFDQLAADRKEWLLKTGSRYIWTDPNVLAVREVLYANLRLQGIDAHAQVVEKISLVIEKYIHAFNLTGSIDILGK